MAQSTFGTELMRQIHDGKVDVLPSDTLAKTRDEISGAMEELLDVGARIRPLLLGGQQIGWVRGVHLTERKALKRWVYSEFDFVMHLLRIATTLPDAMIEDLSLAELRSLCRVVQAMTESDLKLFPYMHAFTTTTVSEQLWYAKGTDLTAFRERTITLPYGQQFRLIASSDHARLWAMLVNYRIQARARLDASTNAVLTIRPWVGKNADPMANDLKNLARAMQTDSFDPWKGIIRIKPAMSLDDGWAHGEDDSVEGMQRELMGMVNNDRHERVIAAFEQQERERAERQQRDIEERILKRRADLDQPRPMVALTKEQVEAQMEATRAARENIKPVVEEDPQSSVAARLARYR